jgi:hypothetical protein
MSKAPTPEQALPRFLAIANALRASGGFFDDWTVLRHSALALPLVEGEPEALARAMRETMSRLREGASWWSRLSASMRAFAATSLIQNGESAAGFYEELKRVRKLFRRARLPRSSVSEVLGFLVLRDQSPGERVRASDVARMGELYREIKRDHRWLLGAGEYPTLALLALTEVPVAEIARRVEIILQRLEERGFRSRGRLLPVAQLLFFAPEADSIACGRFEALWKEFQAEGLRMSSGDYDEVALLAFAPRTPREIVRCALDHREELQKLRPRPGRDISFSLACSTAFLELVGGDPKLRRLSKAQAALQVRSILVARQAAAAGAASAAS